MPYYERRKPMKVVTLRMTQESLAQTERVAQLVDESRSDFIRKAIRERRERVIDEQQQAGDQAARDE